MFMAKPKLPKINILPKISGEATRFQAFWDSFESTVDKNPNVSSIDKFNYLNALLKGTAAQSIQELSLSEVNELYSSNRDFEGTIWQDTGNNLRIHGESSSDTSVCG